jgi:nucleoside phosphorylase
LIALVFPFQTELEAFLAGLGSSPSTPLKQLPLSERRIRGLRTFTLETRPGWTLVVCGQGKVETALACQIVADTLAPSAYLLLGSACALHPDLRAGDFVLADPCIEWDFLHGPPPPDAEGPPLPNQHPVFRRANGFPGLDGSVGVGVDLGLRAGPLLSADRNVFDPAEKERLWKGFDALAAAWEGAGFHRFLRRNSLPGWEIRIITEDACEGRPTLESLRQRMSSGLPRLYPLVDAAAAATDATSLPTP